MCLPSSHLTRVRGCLRARLSWQGVVNVWKKQNLGWQLSAPTHRTDYPPLTAPLAQSSPFRAQSCNDLFLTTRTRNANLPNPTSPGRARRASHASRLNLFFFSTISAKTLRLASLFLGRIIGGCRFIFLLVIPDSFLLPFLAALCCITQAGSGRGGTQDGTIAAQGL